MTLTVLKGAVWFVECISLGLSGVSSGLDSGCALLGGPLKCRPFLLCVLEQEVHKMCIFVPLLLILTLIIHTRRWIFVCFFVCEVFPFLINKYLEEILWDYSNISSLIKLSHTVLASIDSCLKQLTMIAKWFFLFHHASFICYLAFYCNKELSVLSHYKTEIYLFFYLNHCGLMDSKII